MSDSGWIIFVLGVGLGMIFFSLRRIENLLAMIAGQLQNIADNTAEYAEAGPDD